MHKLPVKRDRQSHTVTVPGENPCTHEENMETPHRARIQSRVKIQILAPQSSPHSQMISHNLIIKLIAHLYASPICGDVHEDQSAN